MGELKMELSEIKRRLPDYLWYHIIPLAEGVSTPGIPNFVAGQQKVLRALRGLDLKGKRVLDIGCRDGLYSFEAEKLGAREVIGIDSDVSRGAVELLIPALGSGVTMHNLNVIHLDRSRFGAFDVVVFAGVLYHLRYPFSGLRQVWDVMEEGATLVLETAVFADANRHALLYCPIGTENPYEPSSVTIFNLKGLKDTLTSLGLRTERHELEFNPPPDPKDLKKIIDRVVIICRKDSSLLNPKLTQYWESVHTLHSQGPSHFD